MWCRSKIRIRDGRAKPIDLLAKYISAEDDDLSVEMHEPYTFLNGLTATDMDDLLEDIKVCDDERDCAASSDICTQNRIKMWSNSHFHTSSMTILIWLCVSGCRCTWSWNRARTWISGGIWPPLLKMKSVNCANWRRQAKDQVMWWPALLQLDYV